jgi:hypothetical protein
LLRLVTQREPVENYRLSVFSYSLAKFFISKKRHHGIGQLLFIFWSYQHAALAVLDDFVNALPAAADHWLRARHRFQINASQPFIRTGQREHGAPPHSSDDIITALPPTKMNPVRDAKFRGKPAKS